MADSPRGLSKGMLVVLVATFVVGGLAFYLAKCESGKGKAGRAERQWNAPPRMPRVAALADLRVEATERARRAVPEAQLSRMSGRQLDGAGMVDLDYGGASFEFIAPGATGNCGVEEGMAWQGWQQRLRSACSGTPFEPRCSFADALTRAFSAPPKAVQFVLEVGEDGIQAWTFWPLDPAGKVATVPDDCP
jgi:hypothetical protein